MEITKLADAHCVLSHNDGDHVVELIDAQLALVGGGVGEVGLN